MNAVSLYLSTCRYVMRATAEDASTWADLNKYLPYLRQALSCCVCTNIMRVPMGPTDSICQHHVCAACIGGKMRLRPSCSWCKDHSVFKENVQLRIVIQCYKKLCRFLAALNLVSTLNETNNGDKNSILNIIDEGMVIADSFDYNANPLSMSALLLSPVKVVGCAASKMNSNDVDQSCSEINMTQSMEMGQCNSTTTNISHTSYCEQDTQTDVTFPDLMRDQSLTEAVADSSTSSSHQEDHLDPYNDTNIDELRRNVQDTVEQSPQVLNACVCLNEHDYMKDRPLFYSVTMPNGNEPKLTIRRKLTAATSVGNAKKKHCLDDGVSSSSTPSGIDSSPSSGRVKKTKIKESKRKGCRCGTATPTPGKLTCCGQRCPCYTSYKPCFDCTCRGCHNPRREFQDNRDDGIRDDVEITVDI